MLNIIGKKNWYFLFSILIIIPGLISMSLWGLNLSIDFTGGSRIILLLPEKVTDDSQSAIENIIEGEKITIVTIQPSDKQLIIKTKQIDEKQNAVLLKKLQAEIKGLKQDQFETIGPVIGSEITWNAIKAIIFASILIVFYIAWSFRTVPKQTSSWRFAVCAVIALIHDVLVLLGIFSILGHFLNVEVDSLFITAMLTVIGFSVHDTIVVFDRVRENLRRTINVPFAQVVNDSILQTLTRSLNTSLTALLVLTTLLIFGGSTLQWFIFALIIGIASGTYSSIFNAAQLLVLWQELKDKKKAKLQAQL